MHKLVFISILDYCIKKQLIIIYWKKNLVGKEVDEKSGVVIIGIAAGVPDFFL
ncbi:hypothetical protein BH23BAC2_BH23BAC2_23440 [soil metagenome]